jgi:hypothetical protein
MQMEMEVRLEKLPQVFEPASLSLSSTPQESVVDMTHSLFSSEFAPPFFEGL